MNMADILFWANILAQNNIVRLKNQAYNAIIIKKYFCRHISALIFFTYFICGKGVIMRDYVINEELLCFTQDTIEKDNILVIEKSKRLTFKGNSLKFLRRCCFCYGHSYNIQRQFVIDHFNYYIKT